MGTAAKLTQVKVSVDPGIAAAFKGACAASNASMAAVLTRYMAEYAASPSKPLAAPDYSTRRRRRAAIKAMVRHLEQMQEWEERVRDNMPDNLQGSAAYDAAEEAVASIEGAVESLAAFWAVP